jgi:hypothetical protein
MWTIKHLQSCGDPQGIPGQAIRLRCCLLFALIPVVFAAISRAQDGVSLSGPLSGAIGNSLYSESVQTGPSSTLIPGANSLLNPYMRSDVSDPLGYLIESGDLSPYRPEGALISNYADAEAPNAVLNDATVASRFGEYRNNHLLMSGAGAASLRTGTAPAAGAGPGVLSRRARDASSSFSGAASLAPFAAGSSALAQQPGLSGLGGAINPSASVMSAASPSGGGAEAAGGQGDAAGGSPAVYGSGVGVLTSEVPEVAEATSSMDASTATGLVMRPPNTTVIGPAPGGVFPDVAFSGQASNGFPDSTMGTAGVKYETDPVETSPLQLPEPEGTKGPFQDFSSETTQFLNPSLYSKASPGLESGGSQVSLEELKRRARRTAMLSPNATMPSPFDERSIERTYQSRKRVRRAATGQASSIFPTPSIKP